MSKAIFLLSLLVIVSLALVSTVSAASLTAGPLSISYDGDGPVFSEIKFSPGGTVGKTLTVTNNGTVAHSFALATQNVSGDMASSIYIEPVYDSSQIFSKTVIELANLENQSETVVSSIAPGNTVSVDLQARFVEESENDLQNQTMSFDFVFGTEEAEPTLGVTGLTLTTFVSPTATPAASPSATVSPSATATVIGEVQGEATTGHDLNPYYLLLVPAAAALAILFLPEFVFVALLSAVAGGATYVLGYSSLGNMPATLFYTLAAVELVLIIIICYFLLHHDNRASRKIRSHRHRLRIR